MSACAPPDAVRAILAAAPVESAHVDVRLPFTTRSFDEAGGALARLKSEASRGLRGPLPFLARALLAAEGPFGLEVDVKSDDRVVGVWSIDVHLDAVQGVHASRATGHLHVCASAKGDERATGAFLVVRQGSVTDDDSTLARDLVRRLSAAVLERLDALLGTAASRPLESRVCVLHLVDSRQLARKGFDLAALQARLVHDAEGDLGIAGVELRITRGRGTGESTTMHSTLPAPLSRDGPATAPVSLQVGTFVPEFVSPANELWNRRASDKAHALARASFPRSSK